MNMEDKGFNIDKDLFANETDNEEIEQKPLEAFDVSVLPTKKEEPKREKNKNDKKNKGGSGKGFIKAIILVLVALVLAGFVIVGGADYLGVGFGRGKACIMDIPEGSSTAYIADALYENGTVKMPILFRLYSKIKGYDAKYNYGVFTFNNELGYEGIADMLMEGGAHAKSKTVTIPEMANVDDIANILEKNGICEKEDFIDEVQNGNFEYSFISGIPVETVHYRLEGYLFPDTYNLYVCDDSKEGAHLAISTMLSNLDTKLKKISADIENSDYSLHEIMTMASIVELEAGGSPDEMSKVAAVFYNRLESDEFSTLGSSPTIKYPYGNGRYDTYKTQGLPPGPLCSPSFSSIKAAANPEKDFDYYYFVTDKSMNFYYRKTLDEHNAIIEKLKAEDNWIYENFD